MLVKTTIRVEQCENCFSHVENDFCPKAARNCNGRHALQLLTCARCKEVRYCSRPCQKAQWKVHKSDCQTYISLMSAAKFLGPRVEHTFKSFCKFAQSIAVHLEVPAISALELQKGKNRINSHVFLVKARAKETIFYKRKGMSRGVLTFKLESAECKTMKEMHDMLDWKAGPLSTPETTESTLAHRPGLMRIYVVEVSGMLPHPLDGYTLPTDISNWPARYHERYDPKWFDHMLDAIGQAKKDPPEVSLDRAVPSVFQDFKGPPIPPARPSSPVEGENPDEEHLLKELECWNS